jgi:DNA-binding Lrp family transcriptional regulator
VILMDEVDVGLSLLLLQDSRKTYRELADALGLSVNAVFKRIQKMIDDGVTRGFTANLNLSSLGAFNVVIFGHAAPGGFDKAKRDLQSDENTYWVGLAGGSEIYVGGYLRSLDELDSYVEHVQSATEMPSPEVGIVAVDSGQQPTYKDKPALTRLDYRIVHALSQDSRRALTDIAEDLGVSVKTVRRRLDEMTESNMLDFSIRWYPEASNDIISIFQLRVKPNADRSKVGLEIVMDHGPKALFFWTFSNIPNVVLLWTWSPTMRELRDLQTQLERRDDLQSVTMNIIYTGEVYETWREALLRERIV